MGCYCGCGTRNSKMRWLAAILLGFAALACLAAFAGLIGKCASEINDAKDLDDDDPCVREFEENNIDRDISDECDERFPWCRNASIPFWIFVVLAVLATIPCYAMCCCATPPNKHHAHQAATAVAVQQPAGYGTDPVHYGANAGTYDGAQYGTAAGYNGTQYGANPAAQYGSSTAPYGTAAPAYGTPGYEADGKPATYGYAAQQPTV